MTGVSVSGLCSKDVSYRPVKMSLHQATVKMSLQQATATIQVQCCITPQEQHCSAINFYVQSLWQNSPMKCTTRSAKFSCPVGRMLDPKAGFTILLPPSNLLVLVIALLVFIAGCFLIWTILFTKRLHRVVTV